jgi:hypothetical protein
MQILPIEFAGPIEALHIQDADCAAAVINDAFSF